MSKIVKHGKFHDLLLDLRGAELITTIAELFDDMNLELEAAKSQIRRLENATTRLATFQEATESLLILEDGEDAKDLLASNVQLLAEEHIDPKFGFYHIEYSEDGSSFRWTGPSKDSVVMYFLDRSLPLLGRLRFVAFKDPEIQWPIKVKVDGKVAQISREQNNVDEYVVEFVIAPRITNTARPSEILFSLPITIRGGTDDPRMLGGAFSSLTIEPAPEGILLADLTASKSNTEKTQKGLSTGRATKAASKVSTPA